MIQIEPAQLTLGACPWPYDASLQSRREVERLSDLVLDVSERDVAKADVRELVSSDADLLLDLAQCCVDWARTLVRLDMSAYAYPRVLDDA